MMNDTPRHSPSSSPSADWPLGENERLLWEDSINPAAPINRVVPFFRSRFLWGFFLLLLSAGLALSAYRLRLSGDSWRLPCTDPSLQIELPMQTLNGMAIGFCLVAALTGFLVVEGEFAGRARRQTRYAVTDRRVLIAVGRRLRAIPRDSIESVFRDSAITFGRTSPRGWFGVGLLLRPQSRWRTPGQIVLGPFAEASGRACEALLLGLDPEAESGAEARALPDWLPDALRRRLLALLLPGERILWTGRPVFRRFKLETIVPPLVLIAFLVTMAFADGLSAQEILARFTGAVRLLFVRIGCPFGWVLGLVLLLVFVTPFMVILGWGWVIPAEIRRERSRRFFLVTDRRAFLSMNGILVATDRLFPPVVKRAGRDRANVYFAARSGFKQPRRPNVFNAIGFRDLSVADLPAALAALQHTTSRHE